VRFAHRAEFKQIDLRTQVAETNIKSIRANTSPTLSAAGSAYYVVYRLTLSQKAANLLRRYRLGLPSAGTSAACGPIKTRLPKPAYSEQETIIDKGITTDNVSKTR
jgi:outer membrane protein